MTFTKVRTKNTETQKMQKIQRSVFAPNSKKKKMEIFGETSRNSYDLQKRSGIMGKGIGIVVPL